MRKSVLALSLAAALNANAETQQFVSAFEPSDISTSGNWMVAGSQDPKAGYGFLYAAVVDKPKGWMMDPARGKWIATSKEAAEGKVGQGATIMETWLGFESAGTYCMKGSYLADDEVIDIELWGAAITAIDEKIPYMCAGGKCNALKQAGIATPFEIEFTVSPRPDGHNIPIDAYLWVTYVNHGGPTAFAADMFVIPGSCGRFNYQNFEQEAERLAISSAQANGWNVPITGDWDCDGRDSIGWYNREIGKFRLWNDNTMTGTPDHDFWYGPKKRNWIPIAGDWNGDGCDTVALYNPDNGLFYQKLTHSNGPADLFTSTR